MAEEAVKKRQKYAMEKLMGILKIGGFNIILSSDKVISFIAENGEGQRAIRVTLDKITEQDRRLMKKLELSKNYKKQIYCAKRNIFRKVMFDKPEDIS